MSRELTQEGLEALMAQDTEEVFLVLLTLSHPSLLADICVVNNTEDIVSNGVTYIAFPFELTLPNDQYASNVRSQLRIDNVDRQIVQAIRSINTAPDVSFKIVRAASPDTAEATFPNFKLSNVTYDAQTVSGELVLEEYENEPYPGDDFTPANFPGLF